MIDMYNRLSLPIWRSISLFNNSFLRKFTGPGSIEAMDRNVKRTHESDTESEQPASKCLKTPDGDAISKYAGLEHGKGRSIPKGVLNKLTENDVELLKGVQSSCTDLEKIKAAIKLRIEHRLCSRLPEDDDDSSYYIENGLRKVYPYDYLYQSFAKRRWVGRKLRDVIMEEFRDISSEQMKLRFESLKVLVNGEIANFNHVLKDNDFVCNRVHRHELPVLATPINIIHQDKDTLVIDKPPSVPIHPCGRYRHNSIVNILKKEYKFEVVKVVHRLDRLVSGVLLIAKNTTRARQLENSIRNRLVQKDYVCRVAGEFPLGHPDDDGFLTVDQPLDIIPGKIGITVVLPEGKPSVTKFKRLNYNGKTSAVLCKPQTGRMHQIRVHLQYLGHPIVNDGLYNCDAFGPERGKNGKFGKSLQQLSNDVISLHRASTWLITDNTDLLEPIELSEQQRPGRIMSELDSEVIEFISEDEKKETMAAIEQFHTKDSWKDLQHKCKFDSNKFVSDPTCRDCNSKFHDPPLRNLFMYLHALRYSGPDWTFETELPVWAKDTWAH